MLPLLLSVALAVPQGHEQPPVGLRIVCVDVDQGDGTVVRAPDGTVHVIDGGRDGEGAGAIVPVVRSLSATSYGCTVATHYDGDHIGGLDEVLLAFPFATAYDRGDAARSGGGSVPAYLAAAGARRRTVTVGETVALGGGATMTFVAANGAVMGGTAVPVAGTPQEENARSVAMRIDYREFSMWIGGDLTGGGVTGGMATADVESAASLACGDVDVYQVDHHGSNTSTNANLVGRLRPEVAVVSAGADNPFFHPTNRIVNRLNRSSASIALMGTTKGGTHDPLGFSVVGNLTIDTDGARYRATATSGEFLDFSVDERAVPAPAAGMLRITEVHRDPARVPDENGEYVEITNVGPEPVSMAGVGLLSSSGVYTISSGLVFVPGCAVTVMRDGHAQRNGGLPFGMVSPFNAFSLHDDNGTVELRVGSTVLDTVTYMSGFPGGVGVAAELRDVLGPSGAGNFTFARRSYGSGDLGTPARRNSAETTVFPATLAVAAEPGALTLHAGALSHGTTLFDSSVVALSFGASTGFPLFGTRIPLDFDPLLSLSLQLPGFVVPVPPSGFRSLTIPLPGPSALAGTPAFGAHFVFRPSAPSIETVSPAVPFVFP